MQSQPLSSRRDLLRASASLVLAAPVLVWAGDDKDPAPPRLRVLSYNIHHGEGNDRKFDLPRIAKVIQSVKPDVVALQEVDVKTRRAGGVDQAAQLGKLTGMHHVFGKAMDYSGGQYGEAILSRWKFASTRNVALPFDEGFEPRAAISAVITMPDGGPTFTFIGTHLDHISAELRLRQAKKIIDAFVNSNGDDEEKDKNNVDVKRSNPKPALCILAGDLNATPDSTVLKALSKHWRSAADKHLPTVPVTDPKREIDHILFRPPSRWRVVEVKTIDEKVASDHLPVLAVLELKA